MREKESRERRNSLNPPYTTENKRHAGTLVRREGKSLSVSLYEREKRPGTACCAIKPPGT
jgi:hypothetical protein